MFESAHTTYKDEVGQASRSKIEKSSVAKPTIGSSTHALGNRNTLTCSTKSPLVVEPIKGFDPKRA